MLGHCLFNCFNVFQQQESILIPFLLDRPCAVLSSVVAEDAGISWKRWSCARDLQDTEKCSGSVSG